MRAYLFVFAVAVVVPIVIFTGFLFFRYAAAEHASFERAAERNARQMARLVDGELMALLKGMEGLAVSSNLAAGDLAAFHREASAYVGETGEIVLLRDYGQRQLLNTQLPFGTELPPAIPIGAKEAEQLQAGGHVISGVFLSPISGEPRIAVAIPVKSGGSDLVLAATTPTARLRDAIVQAAPPGWVIGVGDAEGNYVARSLGHAEASGKPGTREYYEKAKGRSGAFTAVALDGTEVIAGYFWSSLSGWLIAANVPRAVAEAPLWNSLAWIGAFGLLSGGLSAILATVFGRRFGRAARGLVERAVAFGGGKPFAPLRTGIREFDVIADAFVGADEALRKRGTELEAVLSTVPAAVWFTYDPRATTVVRNRFAADFMGLPMSETAAFTEGPRVPGLVRMQRRGRDLDLSELPLQRALAGEEVVEDEYVFAYDDGAERIVLISAKPITEPSGRRIGAVAVGLDITERKRNEEQRRLLVNELNHRVKNTLASVQSIAVQTLRSSGSVKDAADSLQQRLVALSRAHDVLNQESWEGAELSAVVAGSMAALAGASRIRWQGPRVWLPPSTSLSMTLVLHELGTNAVKYGALSNETGSIDIRWELRPDQDGGALLTLVWKETGGPPVARPMREGFGTRLISRLLGAEEKGEAAFDYAPDGMSCTIRARVRPRAAKLGMHDLEVAS